MPSAGVAGEEVNAEGTLAVGCLGPGMGGGGVCVSASWGSALGTAPVQGRSGLQAGEKSMV